MWNKHNPNNPFECCHGCKDRYLGCHDKCEKHQKAKAIRKEQNEKERMEHHLDRADHFRSLRYARKGANK